MALARTTVTADGWRQATDQLAAGSRTLLGLWGDPPNVHMALFDETTSGIAVISYACENGTYPSVGAVHPPAIRLERTIRDLSNPAATRSAWSSAQHCDARGGYTVHGLYVHGHGHRRAATAQRRVTVTVPLQRSVSTHSSNER